MLKDIYGIDINNPPNRNNPSIPDEFIKKIFEEKKKTDWEYIKEKYNSNYVAVPRNWRINLNLFKNNDFYSIYRID